MWHHLLELAANDQPRDAVLQRLLRRLSIWLEDILVDTPCFLTVRRDEG